ncbi:MAG TPA: hypothetical protein VFU40_07550 [Gemmatimonadales bacterium]|nr:hypothetical protein [Gemmatimonadales bacterium]
MTSLSVHEVIPLPAWACNRVGYRGPGGFTEAAARDSAAGRAVKAGAGPLRGQRSIL